MPNDTKISVSESILDSIKKLLGIAPELVEFDTDIIIHINSYLNVLTQLGVGPREGFEISNRDSTWKDFIGDDKQLNMVISYLFLRVKLVFDPPQNSATYTAHKERADEFEWRLNIKAEHPDAF